MLTLYTNSEVDNRLELYERLFAKTFQLIIVRVIEIALLSISIILGSSLVLYLVGRSKKQKQWSISVTSGNKDPKKPLRDYLEMSYQTLRDLRFEKTIPEGKETDENSSESFKTRTYFGQKEQHATIQRDPYTIEVSGPPYLIRILERQFDLKR